ncbi:MAG: hypothetical protein JWR75_1807 [Devosia sp.]|nr:hypothetical protein [Devosia sp.]
MKFTTTILQVGKNNTGIVVPPEVLTALGTSKKPAVVVTINGFTYRSTIASMGGKFLISVSADIRAKSGVKGGETYEVELELDTEPRMVEVPADLQAALDAEPAAKLAFEKLSYSNKRQHTLAVEAAKAAETRARRIEKLIADLTG